MGMVMDPMAAMQQQMAFYRPQDQMQQQGQNGQQYRQMGQQAGTSLMDMVKQYQARQDANKVGALQAKTMAQGTGGIF